MSPNENTANEHANSTEDTQFHVKGGILLASVTGFSALFGFGMTLAVAKKHNPHLFGKGLMASNELPESGGALAMRALGWGTLYSISGFSLFCLAVWKLMGVRNLQEFREKMQSIMPEIPRRHPEGRSDFKTVRELLQYIIDDSDKKP